MTPPRLGFKAQLEANQVSSEAMLCPLDWDRGLIVVAVTLLIIFKHGFQIPMPSVHYPGADRTGGRPALPFLPLSSRSLSASSGLGISFTDELSALLSQGLHRPGGPNR